jgi:hypothetical protein
MTSIRKLALVAALVALPIAAFKKGEWTMAATPLGAKQK